MTTKLPLDPAREGGTGFGCTLYELSRAWRMRVDALMRPLGLTSATSAVICTLAHSPQPLTQRELAERIGVEGPTLVRLLDRLEAMGWVRREPVPGDRRMKHAALTEKALPFLDELVRVAVKLEEALLLGIPEERLRVAQEVMLAIGARLDADTEEGGRVP